MVLKGIRLHRIWVAASLATALLTLSVGSATAAGVGRATAQNHVPLHTFIDLEAGVPTVLSNDFGGQGVATATIIPNWGSPLVRPVGVAPGATPLASPFKVQPYLATSWKSNPDHSYTFMLRKGVKSSYGDPFTAADVKYSFDRLFAINPGNSKAVDPVASFLGSAANINEKNPVTIINSYEVKINVTAPSSILLGILTSYPFSIWDSTEVMKHATTTDPWSTAWLQTHSANFGAYQVAGFVPGKTIRLVANPYHWAPVYFKVVLIDGIPDGSTRLQLMLKGAASRTTDLEWANFQAAAAQAKQAHLRVQALQTSTTEMFFMNERYAPFQNKLVRQAVSYAIDRVAINRSIYQGFATPEFTDIPPALKIAGGVKEIPATYNPAKAKQLLAQAGYPNGFPLDLYSTQSAIGSGAPEELALLQAQLGQVGINVQVHISASPAAFQQGRSTGTFPAFVASTTGVVADAGFALQTAYSSISTFPPSIAYSNPTLNKLFPALRSTPAGNRYNRVIADIFKIVDSDVPVIRYLEVPKQLVTDNSIKGYMAYPYPNQYVEYLSR